MSRTRMAALLLGLSILALLLAATAIAPVDLSPKDPALAMAPPFSAPPLGNDKDGYAIYEIALQGASIVTIPSLCAAVLVALLATFAGLVRCSGIRLLDALVAVAGEILSSLPRFVVILVVALILPREWKVLMPIGLVWALLASPGAMDEAAATAERLGGERFVEALRAHGFSAPRIWLYHVVWLNLRPVIVRQAAEVMMQVVFLEISLSYLSDKDNLPAFTHKETMFSWAYLLYQGYMALIGEPLMHALLLSLSLVALVALASASLRVAARSR